MKILIYRWSVFHQEDIAEAFESFGHTVELRGNAGRAERDRYPKTQRSRCGVRPCFFCQLFFTGV